MSRVVKIIVYPVVLQQGGYTVHLKMVNQGAKVCGNHLSKADAQICLFIKQKIISTVLYKYSGLATSNE